MVQKLICFLIHEKCVEDGSGIFIWISREQPERKTRLEREIDATDCQIDQLVYELYGLTEEEIKIVEEGATE